MSPQPLTIGIVGSGIAGMWTAMTLAEQGHLVTLFERDGPPPAGNADAAFFEWDRRGAAQFRHPHAFLGLMCNLIETHHPELLAAFLDAGARRVDFRDMLNPRMRANYRPEPGDEQLWILLCRRATMETVIRRYVQSRPGITIRNHARITNLTVDSSSGATRATGLVLQSTDKPDHEEHWRADLVIDASGRTSKFPAWLGDLGIEVAEQKDDAEIVYYTRHYRLSPGREEPPRGERAGAGDLGYLKFGVFPGDNGNFAIILCLPVAERELLKAIREPEGFDRTCRAIPGLEPWVQDGMCTATTEPFGIGDIHAVWRDFLDDSGEPLIHNFFAVGDSAVRTNPLYGRGCSLGVLHAQLLGEVLAEETDPAERAKKFSSRTDTELRPIFDASLSEDQRGIRRAIAVLAGEELDRPDSLKKWLRTAFGDALGAAAREDVEVLRGFMRTFHLLETPGEFLKQPRIRRKVFRYMLRGRKRNNSERLVPGPDRHSMHSLLGADPAVEASPA